MHRAAHVRIKTCTEHRLRPAVPRVCSLWHVLGAEDGVTAGLRGAPEGLGERQGSLQSSREQVVSGKEEADCRKKNRVRRFCAI